MSTTLEPIEATTAAPQKQTAVQYVYSFGKGKAEGNGKM